MGLLLFLSFLARAALSGLPGTAAGSHNLHYNVTVLSCDGSVQSSFFAGGYLDGQAFLHYDLEKHRAEPWGLWAKELGPEMWDTESKDLTETWKDLRKLLAEILALQEEKGGLHSLQEIMGCEIREDNRARGFRRLSYDGALLLSCHLETPGCAVPQSLPRTLAMEVEKSWDTDDQSKYYQGHVQGELCGRLRGYLESWTGFMERTGPPVVNVTRSQGSEGTVNLTCWALGFFPPNISVAWFWDEEPMSLDAQQPGDVLPDGNGTYRTWVTIRVPQGEEQRVKCHVEHSGNHSAHPAPADPGASESVADHRVCCSWDCLCYRAFCPLVHEWKKKMASAVGSPEPQATRPGSMPDGGH
ncbi:MHC class I polypeptide-related sequence B-like isoform X2 [Hippopotamus amphibius kiboko]|uniref:MHC class I polypeptide-related sequence B-like isoform X2 n=1 Tax=Hippopotamus amphibius kiboko TaxID=575201 RepID=UPI002598A77D|nr:MHC class I polypeptide-related sequence B-like isoform X2 [Hippopotamus amphibius kiboko]